ncbi:hypothetical protein MMC29_001933 [Sticta canariensis]|nr:hypothetical protein [Sticta canariensis]
MEKESQPTLRAANIFELELEYYNSIAHTPIETFDAMRPIHRELQELLKVTRERDSPATEEEVDGLFLKYPLLEFSTQEPGIGEPWSEIESRMQMWSFAIYHLGRGHSEEQRRAARVFWEFNVHYNLRTFKFLPTQRARTVFEKLSLRHYACDELWAFSQNLKLKELTPAQEVERRELERLVECEAKENLINYFCRTIRDSTAGSMPDLRETAEEMVEARTARGDWQMPGPHTFKFHGL